MDWNWFFGAISQCSAAIVGLFGAFIVRGVLDSYRSQNSNVTVLDRLKKNARYLVTKAKTQEPSINAYKEKRIEHTMQSIVMSYRTYENTFGVDQYLSEHDYIFPVFMDVRDKLDRVVRKIDYLKECENLPNYTGDIDAAVSRLDNEYSSVLELYNEVREHTLECESLMQDIAGTGFDVKRVKKIIDIAFILFIIGVIVPLLMLPIPTSTEFNIPLSLSIIKGVILISVTYLVYMMLKKFKEILGNSESSSQYLVELLGMTTGEHYSPFFNNLNSR